MSTQLITSITFIALSIPAIFAQDAATKPLLIEEKTSSNASHGLGYLKGRELAQELMKVGFQIEDYQSESFAKGFAEALSATDSSVSAEDFKVALDLMNANLQSREQSVADANASAAEAFLEINKEKEGVVTTDSGLQYEEITKGEGEVFKPLVEGEEDKRRFLIKYTGTTLDGKVFEQVGGDRLMAVGDNVMPGFKEALKLMPVGSTWKLYMKPELAYGKKRVNALVGPNSGVIFELTLVGIKEVDVKQ